MNPEFVPIKRETHAHLRKLLEMTQADDSLLVLMHGSPDPDAIASAMALAELLLRKKGLAHLTFAATEPFRRQQNRQLAHTMHLNIRLISQVDVGAYRRVALVDAQPSFFNSSLRISPDMVFDHHPRTGDWDAPLVDIRPQYGSLSTVMTEYLLDARVRISRNLHTALSYGIKTDTDNFDRDTITEDISAYSYHTRRANMRLIRRIELDQTPASYLKYFELAYRRMKYYRGRRIGFLGHVESPDVCVQVADFYLRLIGTYFVMVAGIVNDKLVIIIRGDGYRQDCGTVAQRVCGILGQGGGHRSAARIEIAMDVLKQELKGDLSQQNIEAFLASCLKAERRSSADSTGNPSEKEKT